MQRLTGNGGWSLGVLAAAIGAACSADTAPATALDAPASHASQPESEEARALLEAIGKRFGAALRSVRLPAPATSIVREGPFLRPTFPSLSSSAFAHRVEVLLPNRAGGAFQVKDTATAMAIEVGLTGAVDAPAEVTDGFVVYRGGATDGGDIIHRPSADGTEDYVYLKNPPAEEALRYEVVLNVHVAGLRLVSNTLEFLDTGGTPRLRMAPPWGFDSTGKWFDATVAVQGCAYDMDPRGPWGRAVVAPKASRCTVRLQWTGADVRYPALIDPAWISTTTMDMTMPRYLHTASVLPDGRVLVAGGNVPPLNQTTHKAELFDPGSETWAMTDDMSSRRRFHTATVLANGTVLVAGGYDGSTYLANAEIYDSVATGMWSPTTGMMSSARTAHTATSFVDADMHEKVLVVGGSNGMTILDTAEVYDPTTGMWSPTAAPMTIARQHHTATLLADGSILIAGGRNSTGALNSATAYDPASGGWTPTGPMASVRHNHTASLLKDNRVIVAGGSSAPDDAVPITSVEVYNPGDNAWSDMDAPDMKEARVWHTATTLPSGKILVTGGNVAMTLNSAEIFDPIQKSWTGVQPMSTARSVHTASLLESGKVLVAGGTIDLVTTVQSTALFLLLPGDACTNAVDCASGFCVDDHCCDRACTGQCEACDETTSLGTCTLVTGDPHPDASRPPCDGDNAACSSCDGTNTACVYSNLNQCGTTCNNVSETVSLCDGKGYCKPFSTPIPCAPYACIDMTGCASFCTGDPDCTLGFQCSTEGTCVAASTTCIDNQTLQNGGESIDCTPYRCDGNACLQTCMSVDDCIAPNVCDGVSKQCIAPGTAGPGQATGCTCSAAGSAGEPPLRWLAAIALAAAIGRARTFRRMKR